MDLHSVEQQLQQAGLILRGAPIVDDRVHRVRHESDRSGKSSGWYSLHAVTLRNGQQAIIGAAGTWKAQGEHIAISTIDQNALDEASRQEFREQLQRQREQHDREMKQRQEEGRAKADKLWSLARTEGHSDYLQRKKVAALGVRFLKFSLVVPIHDHSGALINLQFITPDGEKRFVTGARKKGGFHLIGEVKRKLLIAEGYATAASLHMALKAPVAVAFDSGNLLPVAIALREKFPRADIIIAGDDDTETRINDELVNVGRIKATEAAAAVGGIAVFPDFSQCERAA
jgi:putative DNA primase/helicase